MSPEEIKSLIWEACSIGDVSRAIVLMKKLYILRAKEGCVCKAEKIAKRINELEDLYRERVAPWN